MRAQTPIDVEVGTGTTTSYTGGFCTYYQYTWQENIYLAQDIQTVGGYINSIAWYSATTNTLNTTDLRIYMGTTTRTTHSSTSDWQPQSELTLVYSSTSAVIGGVVGWKTFTLNTPFYYDGVDNLVVVVAKKASSTSMSTTHRYTNTTNAVLYRNSSTDQSYANYPGTSTGTRSYYLANIKLNITEVLPTCPMPRDVVVSSLTSTDATMSWTPQGTTSVFDLYLTTNTTDVPNDNTTPTVPSVTDTFYTFTSLTPSTHYRAFVRANCSSEYSPWKYLPFTTDCSPITTLPYTENFDSYATGESGDYPTCWGKINTYSSNRPYVNTTHYGASGNSLYFYTGTSGTYNIAVTPPFDASINISDLQAVFMYRATNGTDRLIVGVMSNPSDASSFVPVDTVYPASPVSTWVEKTVYFNHYTGTGQYIAFKNEYTTTGCYAYIDNVEIDNIPTCPKPISLTATAVSSNSVTLSWNDPSSASSWNIEYGLGTFTPGTGVGTMVTATSNPFTVTGLTANTNYTFYVQSDCGGGDLSYFSDAYSERTDCDNITSLPFTENFDSSPGTTSTSASTNNLPNCWDYHNTGTSTSYSGYPIVYSSSTYANSGSNSMRFYTYTTAGTYSSQTAILPPIDPNIYPINTLQLVCQVRALSTSYPFILVVGVMSNSSNINTFTPVDTITVTSTTYSEYTFYFSQYTGQGNRIAIMAPKPTSGYNYGYVDDIVVEPAPSCIKPTNISVNNITSNSVTVGWTSETNHQGWEVAAVPHGGNVSSVTPEYASTNPYTLTNLNSSTTYDLYVRADCGGGDYSAWNMVSFITACTEISALPFVETFDNVTGATSTAVSTNNLPICWNHLCGTYSSYAGYPIVYNSSTYAASGTNALRFYTYTGSTDYGDQYAILPPIDVNTLPLSGLQLTMDVRKNSTSYASFTLIVGVMGNPAVASSFVPVDTIVETGTNYEGYTVDFSNYTGTGNYIALLAPKQTSVTYNTGYVDNIRVEAIPSCDYPTDLMVNNVASTTAFVDWTPGSAENMWEVIILQAGQNISNAIVETATAHPYELTNLADNTPYTVYVRAYCPSGGYSGLSSPVSFTTLPLCTSPRNLSVSQITGSSALVSWDEAIIGAVDYTVEYTEYGMNNWMPTVVNGTSTLLAGLMPQTQYSVRVSSNCTTSSAAAVNAAFTTRCLTGGTVQIGSGTSTSSYLPSYSQSTRSYSQQIFKKEELGAAGTIDTLSIEMSTADSARSVSIYLMHTSATNIFSWIPTSGAQQVYSGSPALHSGWNAIPLTQSFAYNGVDNLLVVVIDNTGRAESASPYNAYRTHTAFPASARYTTGSTYSISSVPSSAGTVLSTRNNIKFGMACDNNVACVAPNVAPTSVTDESITLEWVPGYTENSWVLEYRAGNGNWIQEGTVYNSPYTITNLTPGTPYSVRLRSDCGGSYSDWAGFNTETECSTLLLPYSENFDNTAGSGQGNMVPCWKTLTNYTTAYPYTYSSYHHSGNYSVYFYGTSAYYSYLVSPRFDDLVQMNNLQVRFWAYKTSAAYEIELGIMSDPTDVATFESIGIFSPSATSTWEKFEKNTSNYLGTGHYIAFRMPAGMTSYMYLDDVDVYEIPACDHVDNVHTTGTPTTTSVDVTWTPRGTETQWNVVYGPQGTITDPSAMTPTVVYTPTATLTNLQHSSFYDVYVQADCGSDTSAWEHGVVNTACDRISTLPYMENFENYRGGSSSDNVMPLCWNRLNTGTTAAGCPTVYSSTSTYLSSGTKGLYFYATTASTSADQYAILPEIDVNTIPINTLRLSFKARRYSSTATYVNTIIVGVMTNITSASSFVPVDTVTLTSTTIGTHHVDFTNYTGTGSHIAIKVPKPSGSFTSASYNYLDDILLDVAPACAYPTNLQVSNITTSSATVSWTAGGNENEWEMVLVQGNASMNTGTTYNIYTNTETLSNLTPATEYTIYLRAVCPQGGYSEYITESFSTQCEDLQTLPFTCNFDNVTGSTSGTVANLPVCWTNHSGTYSSYVGYPIVYNSSSYANSGSNSLRFYTGTTTTYDYGNQYAVLPPIDVNLNPINTLQMTLDVRKNNTSYANFTLIVGVMSDPLSVSTFVPIDTIVQTEASYHTYTVYFSDYTGTGKNIAIYAPTHAMNGVTYNTGHVDNIVVEPIPACPPVMNFNVSNVAGSSALLTWEEGIAGMATDFIVEYSEYNQNNWTTETGITGTSYFLSGLNPQTHYEVRVKANCGVSESTWQTADFTTGCLAGGNHQVGNGTTTNYYLPVNNYYRYTYSQQIFLASEMNGPTDIQSVAFQYAYGTPTTDKTSVNIYLGHTTQSVFTSTSNYVPLDSLSLVYSGHLNCVQGWNTFTFDSVFHYNGTSNLVLAVDDNSNAYDGSSYTFYVHSASANRSLYYYSDSNDPSPIDPTAITTNSSYSSGNRSNVKFGGPCDSTVTCIAPNMAVNAVDQTSATVIWAPGNTETSWNLEYKPTANTLWTSVTGITGNTYTLTGLTPSTHYDVRMQSDCGSEVSNWTTVDFMTECGEITILPYMENFDSYGTGESAYPNCWGKINTYSSIRPYVNGSGGYAGPSLYFYAGSTGTYNIAITPPFDANIDITNLQAVFMYKATNNTDRLIVGVMSSPTDASTFVPVDTVLPASPVSTWVEKTVYFHNYTGTGQYIAFKNEYTTTSCYAYIDNLEIGNIPTCPKPLSLTATAVTSNSITLGWTDLSTASSWNIEYGQGTFNPGSGVGTLEIANSNPYTITGLAANTSYTFYVQADCGSGDLSYFSPAYTVSTACAAIDSLPFVENFDSHSGTTSGSANNLPSCWNYINTGTNSSYTGYPIIYSSSTYAHSGSNVLRFYTGTGTYGSQMAILPPIDENLYPMNTLQVSFYARALNTSYPFKLVVGVMSSPSNMNSFTPIDTLNITSTAHALYEIPFGHYSGSGNYIGLLVPQPVTGMNYGYVDNIMVGLMPSCPKPTGLTASNITTTSINLSWNENGTATNWVVEYGLTGFTQGTGTTVQVQGTPGTTITGLNTSTTYDFYVQADCGGGDLSSFSSAYSARTACDAITTLPFTEGFDNYGTGTATAYPPCWTKYSTYTASTALPYCSSTHYAGTGSLYLYVATSGTYNMAILPPFAASIPINTLQATFMHRGTNSTDRTIVGVMSNPADPNTFIPVDTVYPASTASIWTEREVNFSHYTGTGQYIAFMNHYTTSNCYTYVDNLVIDLIPTCPKPTHLTVSAPTTTSLNLSWTENGSATNWVVEYGPAGFTQGTGTTVQVQGTPSTTITGLSASSTYDFYVKSVCGAGDESYWSVKATGATLCGTITQLPYSENFDAYGISSLPSSGATAPMPNCWERINTYSSGVRPFCYTTYNYNSTAGLYFYASSGSYNIAVMPELDASIPVNTLKVSFMYRGFSTSYTTPMSVGVMTDPMNASTYVEVATVPFDATITNWVSREVSFANYTGSGRFIAFRNGSSSATTYAMIDNLVLNYDSTQVGGCAFPTGVTASGITQTSATITWTPGGSENTWELQYKEASSSNWSNSVNVTGTPSHNLTGLTAGTQYQVRVRAVCSTTETSIWAQASFTTASVPVTPPTVTTQAADNISSSAAMLHGTIVPGSENITSRGFEWKETANGSYTAVTATSNTMSHNLTNLTPSTEYTFRAFAITASGTTYGAAMTFTTQTPQQDTCPTPTNVTVTNITSNTAVVSWTQAPGTASSWNVLYKESAADSWYTLTVTSPTTTLAGLTSSTSYDVQVIAHCTNGLESDPSATVTLTTTGINDYALDNSVTVFPNPTTGVVQIKNGEWRMENVEVYDAYGKLLYEMNVNDHTVNLDLGGYAKGTYFVRVTTERGVVTKRVVKN